MAIRVAVIEDHLLVLEAISAALKGHPGVEVVATDTSQADSLRLMREAQPDVIIFDAGTRICDLDPVTAVETLKHACPAAELLILVSRNDSLFIHGLIEAGARGCLLKNDEQILSLGTVVDRIVKGERVYSPDVIEVYFELSRLAFTRQELEVLSLAVEGLSNAGIAKRLGISHSTVRNYMSDIYAKLGTSQGAGTNSRVETINKVRKLGLL